MNKYSSLVKHQGVVENCFNPLSGAVTIEPRSSERLCLSHFYHLHMPSAWGQRVFCTDSQMTHSPYPAHSCICACHLHRPTNPSRKLHFSSVFEANVSVDESLQKKKLFKKASPYSCYHFVSLTTFKIIHYHRPQVFGRLAFLVF